MTPLEGLFIGLLIVATVTIAWFAGLVVVRLYRGQR
jgi:hypothetical protein